MSTTATETKKDSIDALIDTIHIDEGNLEYISRTKKIKGVLKTEIRRVIKEAIKNERERSK